MAYSKTLCDQLGIEGPLCSIVLDAGEGTSVARAATEIGHFSTFSGFLTALAFASLMILITNPPKSKDSEMAGDGGEAFMISMFALIIVFALLLLSTFLFIPITGSVFRPEQQIGFLIGDTILALAVCELFLSLSWFFVAYRLATATRRAAIVTFYFVVFIIVLNASAVLVNVEENLLAYYPKEITRPTHIYVVLAQVSVPIVFALFVRAALRNRFSDQFWKAFTRFILYASLAYTVVLISCYVYLFSGLWPRNVLPFPPGWKDALSIGLGLILASCILALPRWPAESELSNRRSQVGDVGGN